MREPQVLFYCAIMHLPKEPGIVTMDDRILEMLEFPQIRKLLMEFSSFSASTELALNLQPLSDYEQVSLLLRQSAEARHLLSFELSFSAVGVLDVRGVVKMAARGKVLEPQGLVEIGVKSRRTFLPFILWSSPFAPVNEAKTATE